MTKQETNNQTAASTVICSTWNPPIKRHQKLDVNLSTSGNVDVYIVTLTPDKPICKYCCSGNVQIKDYTTRKIAHTVMLGRQSIIKC